MSNAEPPERINKSKRTNLSGDSTELVLGPANDEHIEAGLGELQRELLSDTICRARYH